MLACYMMAFQDLAPERAVINVRLLRPGSCETEEQERAVCKYHDCLRGLTKVDYNEVDDKEAFDARFKKEENGVEKAE